MQVTTAWSDINLLDFSVYSSFEYATENWTVYSYGAHVHISTTIRRVYINKIGFSESNIVFSCKRWNIRSHRLETRQFLLLSGANKSILCFLKPVLLSFDDLNYSTFTQTGEVVLDSRMILVNNLLINLNAYNMLEAVLCEAQFGWENAITYILSTKLYLYQLSVNYIGLKIMKHKMNCFKHCRELKLHSV